MCELRKEKAPRSRAPSFLEAVAFSKGLLAADVDEVLGSARVAGASKSTSEVGTRKKSPLSLAQLAFLEHVTCSHTGQEAVFAGHVCFVVHCRLRWTDSQHCLKEPELDMRDGRGFVETSLYKFKTQGRSAKLRNRLLPVAGISPGVSGLDWASAWLALRKSERLEARKGWPTMPAPMQDGTWSEWPLESAEASTWLREVLAKMEARGDVSNVASHSCKATVLSWMNKSGCEPRLQRLAGYHIDPADKNPLEYGRDGQAPVLHYIEGMCLAIQHGLFVPDAIRSGRWTNGCRSVDDAMRILTERESQPIDADSVILDEEQVDPGPVSGGQGELASESELGDTDGDSTAAEEEVVPSEMARQAGFSAGIVARSFVAPASEGDRYFRHNQSGVVHVARRDHPDDEGECTTFRCGRVANMKYEQLPSFVQYFEKKC